ncbi:hypothetical protein AMJ80_01460 [bacterium SM23_31]|nr:MAG: hypothetical protein AMJ80_01460 [bacterium SM23_31]
MLTLEKVPELYRKLFFLLLLIFLVIIIGTAGYMIIEPDYSNSLIDALFMTTITLSTVGYEEVFPLGDAAKIFTIILIAIGITTLGYGVSSITSLIVEGHIKNTFRDRKMEKAISKLKDHIIVCGHGRLGGHAVKELKNWNKTYVIIEHNQNVAESLKENDELCIHGNAVEDSVLIAAGVERASGLIAALAHDTDNLFVALTARRINPGLEIVSRAEYDNAEVKLISAGANKVISPTQIAGRRMASMLISPEVVNFLDVVVDASELNLTLQELRIVEGTPLDGVPIKDCCIPRELRIIGLKEPRGRMIVNPDAGTMLKPGQTLILLGEKEKIDELKKNNILRT